jgi:hypothetical protein
MPVPDFSPGEVLTAAAMDSIGLWLVKTQTIGTTVATVVVADAFSADYDAYKIIISGGVGSTTAALLACELGATTTGYYWGHQYRTYAGATNGNQGSNAANFSRVGIAGTNSLTASFELVNPFLAKNTIIHYSFVDPRTTGEAGAGGGFLNDTTSYTGFTIIPSTGTLTGGTIRVYGYRN